MNPPQNELNKLVTLYHQGRFDMVVDTANGLIGAYPSSSLLWNILGGAQKSLGKLTEAEHGFRRATELSPHSPDLHNNLGATLQNQGRLDEAVTSLRTALSLKPGYAAAHLNLGNALHDLGRLDEAVQSYRKALQINPDHADAHLNLGTSLHQQGNLGEAVESFTRALQLNPEFAEAHNNLGNTLRAEGRLDEAADSYRRALQLRPDYAEAHNNLGNVFKDQGLLDDAIESYGRALQLNPDFSDAHNNLGVTLYEQGQLDEALESYRKALDTCPDHIETHNNLGVALQSQGKVDAAIESYRRALKLRPDYAEAHNNLGNALQDMGRLDEAVESYRRVLELVPDHAAALAQKLHQQAQMCDWSDTCEFESASATLGIVGMAVPPFTVLAAEDEPEQQMLRSIAWTREKHRHSPHALPAPPATRPSRLRVGYFSADFHDHATLYLMSGMFRQHDGSRFKIHAYSYGATQSGEMRDRLAADVDVFADVRDLSDRQIHDLARDHQLDIAIDLKGYTQNSRSGVFARRLAPIQISFLGYPGTMGADFIDYIVADRAVIPDAQRQNYSENVIYMPHTYQPNDDKREIEETDTKREDFGLPEDAFVFCCFNKTYKITPRVFDVWARLLAQVDGSVLWLIRSNRYVEDNLAREALSRGIDPDRLVFADRLPHAEHLARHKHADLFLDTFNYNAHTTASDALWAGLPLVTKAGAQFSARVGASLLSAVGLPELITEREEAYERLALGLARDPNRLAGIRSKLTENRLKQPLFDTERYTRDFEKALDKAYDRYFEGSYAAEIFV